MRAATNGERVSRDELADAWPPQPGGAPRPWESNIPSLGGVRGGDGLVAANGPDLQTLEQELQLAREIVFDLRNPVGAVRMAVQMLNGPMRKLLQRLDARDRVTVESVLTALDSSTQELCQVVARMGNPPTTPYRRKPASPAPLTAVPSPPSAPERGPAPIAATAPRPPEPVAPKPAAAALASPDVPVRSSRPREPSRPRPAATLVPAPREREETTDVAALLGRLEIMMVTRSPLPMLMAVDASGPLRVAPKGTELLRAIGYLVENAVEAASQADPQGAPWTIDVRAYADPREVLGDELDVVIEIVDRGAGFPEPVRAWLARPMGDTLPPSSKVETTAARGLAFVRKLVEEHQGTLQVRRARGQTMVTMRLPSGNGP